MGAATRITLPTHNPYDVFSADAVTGRLVDRKLFLCDAVADLPSAATLNVGDWAFVQADASQWHVTAGPVWTEIVTGTPGTAGPDADITIDAAGAAGTAGTASRSQHGHKLSTYTSAPAAIGTAAAGTSGNAPSRGSHVHPTGAGTPATVGTANAVGAGPAAAMTDHVHAHEVAHIAHDTLWDAKGDLVVGTGADTAAKLVAGVDNITQLVPDSSLTAGAKWGFVRSQARASGALAETFDRRLAINDIAAQVATQKMYLEMIPLENGMVVTTISWCHGSTATVSQTDMIYGLYDSAATPNLLTLTSDDGTTATAANGYLGLPASRRVSDAAITTGTATLTSATAAFTAADVGKRVTVIGAGAAGIFLGLSGAQVTILSVESGTSCTLNANASTTVSGAVAFIATPYTYTGSTGYGWLCHMQKAATLAAYGGLTGASRALSTAPVVCYQDDVSVTNTTNLPATAQAPGSGTFKVGLMHGFIS